MHGKILGKIIDNFTLLELLGIISQNFSQNFQNVKLSPYVVVLRDGGL